jgi:hypothetical protein
MATVTTPSGERLEGVTGELLNYYRGEANTVPGYVIEEDEAAVTFPRVFDGEQYVEPQADASSPAPDAVDDLGSAARAAADGNAALSQATIDLGKHVADAADVDPSV